MLLSITMYNIKHSLLLSPALVVSKVDCVRQVQSIDMLFLQDLRQRYPSTCGHLVTTSLMLRITSSPDTRGAAAGQPMIVLVPVPPSPVKRQPTPQPKPQTQTPRRAPASAGPGRRTAANVRNNRPQTAQPILTRPLAKGISNHTGIRGRYVESRNLDSEIPRRYLDS